MNLAENYPIEMRSLLKRMKELYNKPNAKTIRDALPDDGEGGDSRVVVTVTESGGVYSADKTFDEIMTAINAQKVVEVKNADDVYVLAKTDGSSEAYFVTLSYGFQPLYNSVLLVKMLCLDDTDAWLLSSTNYFNEVIIKDTTSTNITIARANANTVYEYGELSNLAVTMFTSTGDFIIRFTSGSTATTTNFPASMKFPEAFSAEANTRYEINVSNGYALVASWPTS